MEKVRRNMLGENIMTVRRAIQISNTGDTSRVDEVISPNYFDHESQEILSYQSCVDQSSLLI
jgi:hypothetical protein